jgi:hypothetical protein
MSKQQTAVDWLYNMILKPLSEWPDDLWEQAKEIEKEQIEDAYSMGSYDTELNEFRPDQYYNKTYGKQ